MPQDPLRYFRIEARELVEQLSQGILDLELEAADPDIVGRLLRAAHTFKGAARVVGQNALAEQAHAVEDLLMPYRQSTERVPRETVAPLLALADEMSAAVAALAPAPAADPPAPVAGPPAGTPAPTTVRVQPASAGPPAGPVAGDPASGPAGPPRDPAPAAAPAGTLPAQAAGFAAVRADAQDVDELLDVVGEAHAQFAPLRRQVHAVERTRRSAKLLADRLRARAGQTGDEPPTRTAQSGHATAARLAGELATLARHLTDSVEYLERELDEVRRRAEHLRLVPASGMFTSLRRAARGVADAEGKRVVFEARGGDLRLDPQVLTLVGSAMLHVVSNAVSHGIEPPDARTAAGKRPEGHVEVHAERRGRHGAFICRDDGRGLDLTALRAAAARTGWHPSGDADQDLQELVPLLMRGGISTAPQVTAVSGRGIGMDVLRDISHQLGGEVSIQTAPGGGTTVELRVPLTVVSLRGLNVRAAGVLATVPLDAVRGCLRLDSEETARAAGAGALPYEGRLLPYLPLADLLPGDDRAEPARTAVAIILAAGAETVAVGADELLGTTALVARPLPELTPADAVVDGVTVDVEGIPRIVLDPHALVARAARDTPEPDAGHGGDAAERATILVIDDSLTTRMLERSILESAGYRVDVAASGEEGLAKATAGDYSLFLVDIDMPGIDGFTFTARTRAEPDLSHVPVILVSSRTSAEDRRRGAEAGASGYMAKSEFNQGELLERIRKLVDA
ncbi:hybrid sensor histidine kinase/response regulator [Pilimelia terevasa]|uniref:hybrid sensor histidine kinase/response regulator n=1 Tax=Pilimelia terevasa TaxID=53372 RepID=UPI00166CB44B|nr:response regulator [Pilimelia terevasa]